MDSEPLLDGIYWEKYYNDDPIPHNETGFIFYENRLIGVPRLRQVKGSIKEKWIRFIYSINSWPSFKRSYYFLVLGQPFAVIFTFTHAVDGDSPQMSLLSQRI